MENIAKSNSKKIIKEYMRQDEEMDFMEYARKRGMFFTSDDIEYWERFSKRLKELRILDIKEKEKEKKETEKKWEEIKKRREMFEKIRQEREMLNKEEYKYGEFKLAEEKPKTAAKRVKLSEMSDEELKEYYKKKNEEKEKRKRLQEELKKEKYEAECNELQAELDKMSYKEIKEKYWKIGKYIKTSKYSGYRDERFIYYDEKGKEDKQKSDIIRNAYENKEEIKAYRRQQEEIMKQKAEQDRQYWIQRQKDNIKENNTGLIGIIGTFIFIFMFNVNVPCGILTGIFIFVFWITVKNQNDWRRREIERLEKSENNYS